MRHSGFRSPAGPYFPPALAAITVVLVFCRDAGAYESVGGIGPYF